MYSAREQKIEIATFAAGCFWGVETAFRSVQGVTDTEVGYTGGTVENPTYEEVCTDKTGHAEAINVYFDPDKVCFEELLDTFWKIHDPTQQDGQGLDIGRQYRSAVFYHSDEQRRKAEDAKVRQNEHTDGRVIVTEIEPAGPFYRAEEYHQRYLEKQGRATCSS